MSDVQTPEGWTEEEWRDYFESATAVSEREGEESGMSPVEVPEIQEEAT